MTMQIRNTQSSSPVAAMRSRDHGHPLRAIGQALRADDLPAASAAYSALADKGQKFAGRNPDSPFAKLGAALTAGDLAGAKAAFATMFTSRMPDRGDESPTPPAVTGDPVVSASGLSGGLLNVSA